MNFTCNECNDSGSRDKLGTYLDCNACGTAATRRDLNDFVKSLGPTHPEDVALAIHQRALAMAPKQEAQEIHCQEFHELAMDYRGASPLGAIAAYDALCKYVNQRIAAPAAANGALTDEHVSGIARYLSDFTSSQCNVDKDDAWKIYGDDEIERVRAALMHAGVALSGAKGN